MHFINIERNCVNEKERFSNITGALSKFPILSYMLLRVDSGYKPFQNLPSGPISVLDRGGQSSKLGTRSERVRSERSEEIAYYSCGCPPRSALILTLVEGFEMACRLALKRYAQPHEFLL